MPGIGVKCLRGFKYLVYLRGYVSHRSMQINASEIISCSGFNLSVSILFKQA